MLTDSISPKTYRLLNLSTDRVPSLIHKRCELGLERLKHTLEQDSHKSYGIYLRCGSATSTECLDGDLSTQQRQNVSSMIDKTTDLDECTGYYFIHSCDEEKGIDTYSHYFISL